MITLFSTILKRVFLFYLILEIFCYIVVAMILGWWHAFFLNFIIMAIGIGLLWSNFRQEHLSFSNPSQVLTRFQLSLSNQPFTLLIALLLIAPGFFTDCLALLLCLPWVRRKLTQSFLGQYSTLHRYEHREDSQTIEGEYWQDNDDK